MSKDTPLPIKDSELYAGGLHYDNSSTHRGNPETNDLIVQLAQLVGRNINRQPEAIDSINNGIVTVPGLFGQKGTSFLYYVRDNDISSAPDANFVPQSQGRVKKIVTFPTNVISTDIIRVTVFYYQNPSFPTKVTTIKDYEEAASYYMVSDIITYLVNSAVQNNTNLNI